MKRQKLRILMKLVNWWLRHLQVPILILHRGSAKKYQGLTSPCRRYIKQKDKKLQFFFLVSRINHLILRIICRLIFGSLVLGLLLDFLVYFKIPKGFEESNHLVLDGLIIRNLDLHQFNFWCYWVRFYLLWNLVFSSHLYLFYLNL